MTIESRLSEIRARVEAASNEPWFAEDRNLDEPWGTTVVYNVFHNGDTPDRDLVAEAAYDNAEFIAASRTDLPALLAAVEAVREKLPSLLEAAWDEGNALGLDGWTGPERGEEPDEHAIRRRARLRGKLVDEACEAIAAALEVEG